MDRVKNTVSYCCVWKDGGLLYTYNGGGHEINDLAGLCLEMIPPYHRWYFHRVRDKTFGYLMEDGHVYFAIVDQSIGSSPQVLRFLEKLRDQFRRAGNGKKRGSMAIPVHELHLPCLQEQFLNLAVEWPANRHIEEGGGTSTKAPLLGKTSRKIKDHHVAGVMGDVEMEEHRRSSSTEGQETSASSSSSFSSTRSFKSSSQNLQSNWCKHVRIILAVDAAICIVLFVIWLVICHGTECIH